MIRPAAILACATLLSPLTVVPAEGAELHLRTPHQIITQLRTRITAIGETTKTQADYDLATQTALDDLGAFIGRGDNLEQLTHKDKRGKTPLNYAAYMGYGKIVALLLAQPSVKIALNEPDDVGVTPWTYSVFAARQSAFACNPKIFQSPFAWGPMHASLAYYTSHNAYAQTRKVLEDAGAAQDMDQAKQQWNDICKFQSAETRQAVEATDDLQITAIALGEKAATAFMNKLHRR